MNNAHSIYVIHVNWVNILTFSRCSYNVFEFVCGSWLILVNVYAYTLKTS